MTAGASRTLLPFHPTYRIEKFVKTSLFEARSRVAVYQAKDYTWSIQESGCVGIFSIFEVSEKT